MNACDVRRVNAVISTTRTQARYNCQATIMHYSPIIKKQNYQNIECVLGFSSFTRSKSLMKNFAGKFVMHYIYSYPYAAQLQE